MLWSCNAYETGMKIKKGKSETGKESQKHLKGIGRAEQPRTHTHTYKRRSIIYEDTKVEGNGREEEEEELAACRSCAWCRKQFGCPWQQQQQRGVTFYFTLDSFFSVSSLSLSIELKEKIKRERERAKTSLYPPPMPPNQLVEFLFCRSRSLSLSLDSKLETGKVRSLRWQQSKKSRPIK